MRTDFIQRKPRESQGIFIVVHVHVMRNKACFLKCTVKFENQLYVRIFCCCFFPLKCQFHNQSDGLLIRDLASVSFSCFLQMSVLGVCHFGKRVWNSTKRADWFTETTTKTYSHRWSYCVLKSSWKVEIYDVRCVQVRSEQNGDVPFLHKIQQDFLNTITLWIKTCFNISEIVKANLGHVTW